MKTLFQLFGVGVILCVPVLFTHAASIYIDPAFSTLNRGDAAKLSVRVDVDEAVDECINAVEGVITYTPNITPVDISIGDSIFSIWVEEPTINAENNTITFAGGLPNGYCGRVAGDPRLTNTLFELIVRSPGFTIGNEEQSPTAAVELGPETAVYLNDGFGTRLTPDMFGAQIELTEVVSDTIVDPWREEVAADTIPPEEFSITLSEDNTAFGGKYFIVFNTTDKQTGIDQYQVMEEPFSELGSFTWGRVDAPWVQARSPYVLQDQSLNSTIRVKAIDKAGNEYIATLIPEESQRKISSAQVMIILVSSFSLLILIGIAVVIYQSWRRKKRRLAADNETNEYDETQ